MNFKNNLLILSLLLAAIMCIGSVAAIEDNYGENNNLTADSSDIDLEINDESVKLGISDDDSVISSDPIIVDGNGGNYNEMSKHSIRNAINSANAGDTIVISGESYVHTHVVIDKPLTIRSDVGTKLSSCSSTDYSGHQGIFYITSQASGTIIEGFNFNNDDGVLYDSEGYAILINGASNVVIRNCTFSTKDTGDAIRLENAINAVIHDVTISNAENGIKIKNSQNVIVKDSTIANSNYGIYDVNSTKTTISTNNINNNKIAGIKIAGTSQNPMVISNNITSNKKYGVELTSSKNINILSNYIAFNTDFGVYVDCPVEKIKINGNFFNKNVKGEVYNSNAVNNVWVPGGEELEEINNNYMIGLNYERAINRAGSGGVFLGYVFEINENVDCPIIHFNYYDENWARGGNYELQLSNITQIKRGIYSISIVDENGNIATDLSSVPVTFYLNKVGKSATPKATDTYRTVMMKNGTATVRFYMGEFNETGNVITAVVPTPGANIDDKVSKTFTVPDEAIPGVPVNTVLTVTSLNTYPNSNQEIVATLKDVNGKAVVGEPLIFNINSKTYTVNTDGNGQAKLKINEPKDGTYPVKVTYNGDDDVEYYGSSAQGTVVVKSNVVTKKAARIISSNFNMIPKKAEYYSITLKDENGKVLANQKVTFKVNGKKYTVKTNSKGVAKVKLKFNKNKKTYKIKITYKGTAQYKAASKTQKIKVKYSSKKAKLTTPTVSILPKKSSKYTVSLKDESGKGISKQKITVKINGRKYTKKTNKKGQVTIKVKFSKKKTYKVTASYKGNKIYKKASSKGKIIVDEVLTVIDAPSISAFTKQSKTYTATLKTKQGKAVSNQKLTFAVDGRTYTQTTDKNGQASINVQFNNENTYPVTVKFAANGVYKASSASGKITVSKRAAQLESNDETYYVKSTQDYQVTLKDQSGNPLANQEISFAVNGSSYSRNTDLNGHAGIDVSVLPVGSHEVVIRFAGNDLYNAVSKTSKITILSRDAQLESDDGTFYVNSTQYYNVTLNNQSGNPLANQEIIFEVNGSSYSNNTDLNGQAGIYVSVLPVGCHEVVIRFAGNEIYNAVSKTNNITILKMDAQLESQDRTFSLNSSQSYWVTLKDQFGNPFANQEIIFAVNGSTYSNNTDLNGQAIINLSDLAVGSHNITIQFAGNDLYNPALKTNSITVLNKTNTVFVDSGLSNADIQALLDSSREGNSIVFLGESYLDISLNINKPLNVTSSNDTVLNAKAERPVFKITADNVNISGFSLVGNSNDAIVIENVCNVSIFGNAVSNMLDESKMDSYLSANINLPGYGIGISNSSCVMVSKNSIKLFESGIFAQNSSYITIFNNTLRENNYGIKYGYGVENTNISYNEITDGIGLYTMVEVEGPTGYGIYLNNSAVNVTIFRNHIYFNHMGISLDANYSTGIVITENLITDNVLEGIRFNAGYDLAQNAVQPHVTDNAIYRNARGPSKMILGELSANPAGIYGAGEKNASARLQLEANWYGINSIITWNDENGTVGYGTMCPRINTSAIKFNNITFDGENYTIEFYKNDVLVSNLPTFDLFATLNWETDHAVEVNFNVVNGVGTFKFNESDYDETKNTVSITVATLVESTSRVPRIISVFEVPQN